jgi:Rod binding domain-containing protein
MEMQIAGINAGVVAGQMRDASSQRLVKAAHEFEGQMMKELLKPMTASEDDGDDDSGSGGALGEFASEALGQGLSQQGGFGIADRIVKELSHSGKESHAGNATGNLHSETAINSQK